MSWYSCLTSRNDISGHCILEYVFYLYYLHFVSWRKSVALDTKWTSIVRTWHTKSQFWTSSRSSKVSASCQKEQTYLALTSQHNHHGWVSGATLQRGWLTSSAISGQDWRRLSNLHHIRTDDCVLPWCNRRGINLLDDHRLAKCDECPNTPRSC